MKTSRRILALLGAASLLVLYLLPLCFSLYKGEYADAFFKASLVLTILVPVLLYAMLLIARVLAPGREAAPAAIVFTGRWGNEEPAIRQSLAGLKGVPLLFYPEVSPDELAKLAARNGQLLVIADSEPAAAALRERGLMAISCENASDIRPSIEAAFPGLSGK